VSATGVIADGALAVVPFAEADAAALCPGQPASVTIADRDAGLRDGQTARVAVTTVLARDVLVEPNAAVIRDRDASYVDLVARTARSPGPSSSPDRSVTRTPRSSRACRPVSVVLLP
jgi:hypothetical protein